MGLGSFGWEAIRARRGETVDLESLARDAACHYLDERDSGRPGWRYPPFRAAAASEPAGRRKVELPISDPVGAALAREAERQGVVSERLLEHALLYHLADLHAGRIGSR